MTATATRRAASGRSTTSRRSSAPAEPFTVEHFRAYCGLLVLDNGEQWQLEDWQAAVAADFFDGFPQVWLIVPEGNGKTTLMAGLALYHADYMPGAAVLIAAAAREQAELMYDQAAGFVRRTPGLDAKESRAGRFRCFDGYRRIKAVRTSGRIQVKAADEKTGDGVIPTLCLIDELHRHRDLALLRTWRGKLRKRGGQIGVISTAGEPGTEFEDAREAMKASALDVFRSPDGCYQRCAGEHAVIHDYAVPSADVAERMDVVASANPLSLVTAERLREDRDDPTMTREHWLRFKCNIAVRGEDSAITPAEWDALVTDERIPPGEPVWVGLDLGWKWDTTAVTPLWMPDRERRVFGHPTVLVPPRDGTSTDPADVQEALLDVHRVNPVHTVVMDENAGGAQLASWIEAELGARVVSHSQGHSAMALAYERWMEAMREAWLRLPADETFRRHALNAVARLLPGGQVRFDRPARSRAASGQDQRVWDALTAASMVHSAAVTEASEPKQSNAYYFL